MSEIKIIIKDEVNVKIEGLEVGDRRALMKMFEFEKPGARYLPAVRLGRWNGKISYFSLGGSTYVNLLEQIITYLYDKNHDIELVDLRQSHGNLSSTALKKIALRRQCGQTVMNVKVSLSYYVIIRLRLLTTS